MKGTYILLIKVKKPSKIKIGSLEDINFEKGLYCYIGSGMNNLGKRIQRHLSNDKKIYWHIDYLLSNKNAKIKKVLYRDNSKKEECKIAREISKMAESIKNFGCSDCKCDSHLFKVSKLDFQKWINQRKSEWKNWKDR